MIKILGRPKKGKDRRIRVEFSLRGVKAKTIYLVGPPGSAWWPSGSLPLQDDGKGNWKITLSLMEGEYPYLFEVNEYGKYKRLLDPDNPRKTQPVGWQEPCSLLIVGDAEVLEGKGKPNDGKVCGKAIYHDQTISYLNPLSKSKVIVKIRTLKNDVSRVKLIYFSDAEHSLEMEKIFSDKWFDYYKTTINIETFFRRYLFQLKDGSKILYYCERGAFDERPSDGHFVYDLEKEEIFETPEWAKNAVFYQIFPDRFCNGDKRNDPPKTRKWGRKPTLPPSLAAQYESFGGDLEGIIEKMPYLKELGITAIYLTPVFESPTNHKYNITDYYKIDRHFGDFDILKELVKKAHSLGIKVILDGVFHCTSDEFWALEDIRKNQQNSKYVNWYIINHFPVMSKGQVGINPPHDVPKSYPPPPYESYLGIWVTKHWFGWCIAKFNAMNPETREYLMNVGEFWIKEADIDGWRIDSSHAVPHPFWKEFRKRIKKIKPDTYILGECPWPKGDAYPWLEGDEFDAAMNYRFREAVVDFFAEGTIDVETFDARLAELRTHYPLQANEAMYNLIGSHDTPRYLALCEGDLGKMKISVLFQMTYLGPPAIYYGDEIGMTHELGRGDMSDLERSRGTMIWDEEKQNRELLNLYEKSIRIRQGYSALRTGSFKALIKNNKRKIYAYERRNHENSLIVVLNNDSSDHEVEISIKDGKNFKDLLNAAEYDVKDGKLRIPSVKKRWGAILLKQ